MVGAIKHHLSKAKDSWADELPLVLWGYRTGYCTATGYSPYNLIYGSEVRLPIEVDQPNIREYSYNPQDVVDARLTDLDLLDERREEVASNLDKQNKDLTRGYDARVIPKDFIVGDLVLRWANVSTPDLTSRKLDPKWEGPYRVTCTFASGTCTLESMEGVAMPRSWHPINLYPYV